MVLNKGVKQNKFVKLGNCYNITKFLYIYIYIQDWKEYFLWECLNFGFSINRGSSKKILEIKGYI